jgi:hypothetical protein
MSWNISDDKIQNQSENTNKKILIQHQVTEREPFSFESQREAWIIRQPRSALAAFASNASFSRDLHPDSKVLVW